MITIRTEALIAIKTQIRHIDIMEEALFDAQVQLKKMREEHQAIIDMIKKEEQ